MNTEDTANDEQQQQQRQQQRQQMNRSSSYILLLLFALLFFNFSEDSTMQNGKPTKADVLQELEEEKQVLSNMTFGTNITWPLPMSIQSQLNDLWSIRGPSNSHFYHNVSGIFRGDWVNQNISLPDSVNKTLLKEARSQFDFDLPGTFKFNVKSVDTLEQDIHYVEGYMRMKDAEKSSSGALLLAGGLHFLNNGSLYLIAVPDGHAIPLKDMLNMLPSNSSFMASRKVLNEQIDKRVQEINQASYWEWQALDEDHSDEMPFQCHFQFFAQLHPVSSHIKMSELLEYERELEHPQGITTIHPPPFLMSSELYSPNCHLLLSSREDRGIKIEHYYNKAMTYAGLASILAVVQIFALIHQMEYTPTPSSVSNVSYWTIAMQAMMDGYLCLLHLTTGVVVENVFLPFATAAFFTFVLVSIFGMRYLLVVWRIQRPESIRASQANTEEQSADTQSLLPTANVRRPNPNEETNPQREITFLYYRLYAVLLLGLFLFYQSVTRSAFVQNVIIGSLGLLFYSFWVPQIARNVTRGCRHPLSYRYILIMSLTRLSVPLYFYGCPENLIGHDTTPWVFALVAYVGLQVFVLFLQDSFGPRFFIPSRYLPQTYDYHPILSHEDEEAETISQPPKDCAICMLPIDPSHQGNSGLNVLSRTNYMVTPCHHMFHTDCLEKWMRIKLECPVCRAYLPAC